jgi:hypothetical protein
LWQRIYRIFAVGPLEIAGGAAHIRGMTPVDNCKDVLCRLIRAGQTNGIPLAEKAVDECLAVTLAPRKDLRSIQLVVQKRRDAARSGNQRDFAETVSAYIEKQIRDSA